MNNLLSEFKLVTGYLRYNAEQGRKETWDEAVSDRIMGMHRTKYADKIISSPRLVELMQYAEDAYKEKYVLGSQRALQFGGEPILRKNAKMYNCLTSYCDRVAFFRESMWWLLAGCGVGAQMTFKRIDKLPTIKRRDKGTKTFIVPDSIEGWADALGVLMSSYFREDDKFKSYYGYEIKFDFSKVRPKGSYISSGFKAPGPDPLRNALIKIEDLIQRLLGESKELKVRPIVAYDILMHASDAVLSGGVRRSATIILFSPEDDEMMNAKTGNWFDVNPQRGRSNNSVLLVRNQTTREQFHRIMQSVKDWGEPGFVFVESDYICVNPCVEIGMVPVLFTYDDKGNIIDEKSGWQGCNLTEGNGSKCRTREEFLRMCKASAILGTLQAGYTSFEYVGEVSEKIFEREALLGCSITGMMSSPKICFDPELQREGAELIKAINKEVAEIIGINQSARTTCVKPSGNSAVLLGTSSGIHGDHSRRYFRNVQVNSNEYGVQFFKEQNTEMFENSAWKADDYIISFPIESSEEALFKQDLIGVKQLEYVKLTQQNWVEAGTNVHLCTFPCIRHNVSNTIQVDDWEGVEEYIFSNKDYLAGISLLSSSGDKDYVQAPFVAVYNSREMIKEYGDAAMFASGLIVDALSAFNDNLWSACSTLLGNGEKLEYTLEEAQKILDDTELVEAWKHVGMDDKSIRKMEKHEIKPSVEFYVRYLNDKLASSIYNYGRKRDWIRRAKKFAKNYLSEKNKSEPEILKRATYCLKDVHNWHKWIRVKKGIKNVVWTEYNEVPDYINVDTLGAASCVGTQCEVL